MKIKTFTSLTEWYHLITRLEDYKEEALIYKKMFLKKK
ncbi:hypothetical protein DFR58_1278 [Anaerobacterium chartisolvens]|uniref:Uncharacterized protein n=1 Tax=Anaerobacterium chartisolvens TaxID=1297424 RepID=A0A369AP42_9FIRM|nr:hypothetical protein DFR58_1278 [Anaerobacterium chartisolvens]